jgi:hypothetical protein
VGCAIHKDKGIFITADREAVTKRNVHVNGIQVEILGFVEQKTMLGFGNGSKGTQQWGKFATVNSFAIGTHLKQSFIITKCTATHSMMKLLRCPVSFCVRVIGRITRAHQRERRSILMQEQDDFFPQHCGCENR